MFHVLSIRVCSVIQFDIFLSKILGLAVVLAGGYANGGMPQAQSENDSSNTTVSPAPLWKLVIKVKILTNLYHPCFL